MRDLFNAVAMGDPAPAVAALASTAPPLSRSWQLALAAALSTLNPASPAPDPFEVESLALANDAAKEPGLLACARMERACLFARDNTAMQSWLVVHRRIAPPGDLTLDIAEAWAAFLRGSPPAVADTDAWILRSKAAADGALQVEAAVLRAIAMESLRDTGGALKAVRRACRMAQAEGRPEGEILSHWYLCLLRRRNGQTPVAVYVLSALARVSPPGFIGLLAWELLLSGAAAVATQLLNTAQPLQSPVLRHARAGVAVLSAAQRGDRVAFRAAASDLVASTGRDLDLRHEAEILCSLIDVTIPAPSDEIAAWRRGAQAPIPLGMEGMGQADPLRGNDDQPLAYVYSAPGVSAGRLSRAGLPLFQARNLGAKSSPESGGLRTETGLAVLALAGTGGLSSEAFFGTLYGFAFHAERHSESLRTLVHRMRSRLGPAGDIDRSPSGDHLVLLLHEPVMIPDGRCIASPADGILRVLAAAGEASAQSTAAASGLPLRTVQRTLQQLVSEGLCRATRVGRQVAYRIEDTAFTSVNLQSPNTFPT